MPEYLTLMPPTSESLRATEEPPGSRPPYHCPLTLLHSTFYRRTSDLQLQVKHNKRDQWAISSWTGGQVFHERVLAEFERLGLSGYRTKPALVRFRDGLVSAEYRELIVVGWAGIARPESGIQLLEECPGCLRRRYSSLRDAEQLIDWNQWTGEDFFLVWPLVGFPLITKGVAEVLESLKVKSYTLGTLRSLEKRNTPPLAPSSGFGIIRLSAYLPEDLAIKYGRPLGLE